MKRARRVLVLLAMVVVGHVSATPRAPAADDPAPKRLGPFKTPPGVGPSGPQLGQEFRLAFAVYHLPRPRKDPTAELAKLLAGDAGLTMVKQLPDVAPARPQVALLIPPIKDAAPPDDESLRYYGRGMADGDYRAVAKTRAVSVLLFAGPGSQAQVVNRRAQKLVADLASACNGLIWDPEARLMYSQAEWQSVRASWAADGTPDIRRHIAIHAYRDGELIRMITLGMSKFALPDVVVNQVATGHDSMEAVINVLSQRLVEGGAPAAGRFELVLDDVRHGWVRKDLQVYENAQRRATLRLQKGKREQGDAENRLLEIAFPGPSSKVQEQHSALLTRLFGSEDKVVLTEHDQALEAASARARQAVLKHKPRYRMQPPFGEQLLVKAPFEMDGGGNEWMWVEVVRWEGVTIDGILQNDAQNVAGLKSGARVRVDETTLFDYQLTRRDGSREGNETQALLEKAR